MYEEIFRAMERGAKRKDPVVLKRITPRNNTKEVIRDIEDLVRGNTIIDRIEDAIKNLRQMYSEGLVTPEGFERTSIKLYKLKNDMTIESKELGYYPRKDLKDLICEIL